MSRTPATESGLRKFDYLPPADAVLRAWTEEGDHPYWHWTEQRKLRRSMPLLARALDRLARERRAP